MKIQQLIDEQMVEFDKKFKNIPKLSIAQYDKDWDLFRIPTKYKANKWDGHTTQDVLKTLSVLATLKEKIK